MRRKPRDRGAERIDEYDTTDLIGMGLRVGPGDQAAQGMADHQIGRRNPRGGEHVMKLGDEFADGPRLLDGRAAIGQWCAVFVPKCAGPIVCTYPVRHGERGKDRRPDCRLQQVESAALVHTSDES